MKARFAGSLREAFYSKKPSPALGPGSFTILREFDKFSMPKVSKDSQKAKDDLSLNLSLHSKQRPNHITPGPGLYSPEKAPSHRIPIKWHFFYALCEFLLFIKFLIERFKTAPRKELSNPEKVPGPGAYTPEIHPFIKGKTFSKAVKKPAYIDSRVDSPGPGNYKIQESLFKSNSSVNFIGFR